MDGVVYKCFGTYQDKFGFVRVKFKVACEHKIVNVILVIPECFVYSEKNMLVRVLCITGYHRHGNDTLN